MPRQFPKSQLIPVHDPQAPVEGALSVTALSYLPFAYDAEIPSPSTAKILPVPHGNLMAYAAYLIQETGNQNLRFILTFHHYFGDTSNNAPPILPITTQMVSSDMQAPYGTQGVILDLNDPEVQRAIKEGRIIIK
jgi:hypothetical protein